MYGLLTEPGGKSGNFSIWASKSNGNHSWEIVHLNMTAIFNGKLVFSSVLGSYCLCCFNDLSSLTVSQELGGVH